VKEALEKGIKIYINNENEIERKWWIYGGNLTYGEFAIKELNQKIKKELEEK